MGVGGEFADHTLFSAKVRNGRNRSRHIRANGGLPTLTVVLVIMTAVTGAVLGPMIARLARIEDPPIVGLTMGIASHGIGTARALQINEVAGAFSGLGMGLNGVLTAILLPVICRLF